jgi:hypothetical protein
MNLSGFTELQKEKLLDLLLLGMYADAHLARAEEARIQKLLEALHFPSADARNRFADAGIARVRTVLDSPEAVAGTIGDLAKVFAAPDVRRKAAESLELLLFSDTKATDREREFLAKVRKEFGC